MQAFIATQLTGKLHRILDELCPNRASLVLGQRRQKHDLEQAIALEMLEQIDQRIDVEHQIEQTASVAAAAVHLERLEVRRCAGIAILDFVDGNRDDAPAANVPRNQRATVAQRVRRESGEIVAAAFGMRQVEFATDADHFMLEECLPEYVFDARQVLVAVQFVLDVAWVVRK